MFMNGLQTNVFFTMHCHHQEQFARRRSISYFFGSGWDGIVCVYGWRGTALLPSQSIDYVYIYCFLCSQPEQAVKEIVEGFEML